MDNDVGHRTTCLDPSLRNSQLRQSTDQLAQAFTCHRRDPELDLGAHFPGGNGLARAHSEIRIGRRGLRQIGLGAHNQARTLEESGLVPAELADEDLQLLWDGYSSRLGQVDEQYKDSGSLYVPQEPVSQAPTIGCALY